MEYTVPQFTEYEAKIFGPFTFKQFVIVMAAAIVCFIVFFKTPWYVYIPVWMIVGGGAVGLTFLKIGGRSPAIIIKNFFFFSLSPKIYLWKRKVISPQIIRKEEKQIKPVEEKEESKLKVIKRSRLNELYTHIETKKE